MCRAYYITQGTGYILAWLHIVWLEERLFRCFGALFYVSNYSEIKILSVFPVFFSSYQRSYQGKRITPLPLCEPCMALFVFWSGLPRANNGLPSTHKSHLYTSFDPLSNLLHHVLLSAPHICLCAAIFSHKRRSDNSDPFSYVLERHFYRH